MSRREIEKLENAKMELQVSYQKASAKEKSLIEQLHEVNLQYTEVLKKYDRLEDRTSNVRAELVRVTKERNDAETDANKYKLKSKIRQQKLKVTEEQLTDKVKECDSRHRTGETLRKVNEEMRAELEKLQAKYKHTKTKEVKSLEKIIKERD